MEAYDKSPREHSPEDNSRLTLTNPNEPQGISDRGSKAISDLLQLSDTFPDAEFTTILLYVRQAFVVRMRQKVCAIHNELKNRELDMCAFADDQKKLIQILETSNQNLDS